MKIAKVKIHCGICGNFQVEHDIDTNEHGYFSISDAYCPECGSLLTIEINSIEEIK